MTKTPIAVLGIDLGKNSCSLAGLDASGAVILRQKMTRERVVAFAAELPADTDEAGHAFQSQAGRVFRFEAGHPWRHSHGSRG